jgi:peptidoglycan/xylan/chitin deacetylase (PgdA/CDA1 family)
MLNIKTIKTHYPMKRHFFKHFFSLNLCLSLFLSACSTLQNSSSNNATHVKDSLSSELQKESSSESESIIDSTPLPEDTEIWDVTDVDLSKIDTTKKLISFTFDDSPSSTIENIFAVFADFNEKNPDCPASATVFFNGLYVNANTLHHVHTAHILGFELGNHTFSHFDLTTLSEEVLSEEIDKTDDVLFSVDGQRRHLLRAPYGRLNDFIKERAPAPLIDWTIDTVDWSGVTEESIYNAVANNLFDGAIVLMHDGYANTVSALKKLLPHLKEAGYQVVSVSQLAKAHNCVLKKGRVYVKAKKHNESIS